LFYFERHIYIINSFWPSGIYYSVSVDTKTPKVKSIKKIEIVHLAVAGYRFAVEYMSYAEAHFLSFKESSEIQTLESLKSNENYLTENVLRKMSLPAEELSTVPVALARKYLYLYNRYAFADRDQMMGMEEYQLAVSNRHLWASILNQAEVNSVSYKFLQLIYHLHCNCVGCCLLSEVRRKLEGRYMYIYIFTFNYLYAILQFTN
jgi:hypothetical protein